MMRWTELLELLTMGRIQLPETPSKAQVGMLMPLLDLPLEWLVTQNHTLLNLERRDINQWEDLRLRWNNMPFLSQTRSKWVPKRPLKWVFLVMRWNSGIMMLTSLSSLEFTKKSSQGTILMTSLDLKKTSQMPSTRLLKTLLSNKTCCIRNRQGSLCPCRSRNAKRNWNSQSQLLIKLITNKPMQDF